MRRLRFGLAALPAATGLLGLRQPTCMHEKRALYGSRVCGADTLNELISASIIADAPIHTLEMQARGGVAGERLLHLGADHSVPVGKAIKVGKGHPGRAALQRCGAQDIRCTHILKRKATHRFCVLPYVHVS